MTTRNEALERLRAIRFATTAMSDRRLAQEIFDSALDVEISLAALTHPPVDTEGQDLRRVAEMAMKYFRRGLDFDRVKRGRMDERHFIQDYGMSCREYQELDHSTEEASLASMLKVVLHPPQANPEESK